MDGFTRVHSLENHKHIWHIQDQKSTTNRERRKQTIQVVCVCACVEFVYKENDERNMQESSDNKSEVE